MLLGPARREKPWHISFRGVRAGADDEAEAEKRIGFQGSEPTFADAGSGGGYGGGAAGREGREKGGGGRDGGWLH